MKQIIIISLICIASAANVNAAVSKKTIRFQQAKNGSFLPAKYLNVSLLELTRAWAKQTKQNIVFGSRFANSKDTVSFVLNRNAKAEFVESYILRLLYLNSFVILSSNNFGKIIHASMARESDIPLFSIDSIPNSYRYGAVKVKLKHPRAEKIEQLLRLQTTRYGRFYAAGKNEIYLVETGKILKKLVSMIRQFDQPENISNEEEEVIALEEKISSLKKHLNRHQSNKSK